MVFISYHSAVIANHKGRYSMASARFVLETPSRDSNPGPPSPLPVALPSALLLFSYLSIWIDSKSGLFCIYILVANLTEQIKRQNLSGRKYGPKIIFLVEHFAIQCSGEGGGGAG